MNIGIIIETNEPEKAWNAVRFGNAAITKGHLARIFLMGAGVEIQSISSGKYDANTQLLEFSKNGGIIFACGTCMKSRNQDASEVCPISTMDDCIEMVEWSDKVVTF